MMEKLNYIQDIQSCTVGFVSNQVVYWESLFCQSANPLSGEEIILTANIVKFKSKGGDKSSLPVVSHKALSSYYVHICNSRISGDWKQMVSVPGQNTLRVGWYQKACTVHPQVP